MYVKIHMKSYLFMYMYDNDDRIQAYADRPFKHEYVHISAPHMYATGKVTNMYS
jgi:hypothetical protein